MLRVFFHHESVCLRALELVGAIGLLAFFSTTREWLQWSLPALLGSGMLLCATLFLRVCATRRWYPRHATQRTERRYLGIELHFRRVLGISTYATLLSAVWLWLGGWPSLLWSINLILGFFCYVNAVLLRFHRVDEQAFPVNAYSAGTLAPSDSSVLVLDGRIDTPQARHI